MLKKSGFFKRFASGLHLGLVVFFLAGVVQAGETGAPQVRPDHPQKYTVVKGDTLWGIAGRFLMKPWLWPEIWRGNPQIEDPHLIYPGDVITLIWEDGKPVLTVDNGKQAEPIRDRYTRLSPEVRVIARDRDAISAIPLDVIHYFLEHPRLLSAEFIDGLPYVVDDSGQEGNATVGDTIYVRGLPGDISPGDRYTVYTKGDEYRSPRNGEVFGHKAIYVADVVLEHAGDPSAASVIRAEREIRTGDRLLVYEKAEYANTFFVPKPFPSEIEGHIISVFRESLIISKYQVVVLDLGSSQGLRPGHVLGIYAPEVLTGDPVAVRKARGYADSIFVSREQAIDTGYSLHLPGEQAGVLMVFRALDKISYAIVMDSRIPIRQLARVRNL